MTKKMLEKQNMQKYHPTVLLILDGFGLADSKNTGNAITLKTAPHIFGYMKRYPYTTLKAHGKYVGLFKHQQGNSEAGHINIGAGRVVKQDLLKISDAINDGTFFKNEAFRQAIYHAKKYKTNVHVMGLLTDEHSAHANPEHMYALLKYFRQEKIKQVYVHIFTDGRDSPPHSATNFLHDLRLHMKNGEKIATVIGRFYAMDRNKIWKRTQQAYEAMVQGKGCSAMSAEEALAQSYNRGDTDEFICPTVIIDKNKPVATIQDNDVIFFTNARSDRARQITKVFVQDDFNQKNPGAFIRYRRPKNIRFVAMTDFGPDLPGMFTAFPSADLKGTLPMALEHKKQLYISESEKYAHVTYFINGGYADSVAGEIRMKIDSPHVSHYEKKPEMSADNLTKEIIKHIKKNTFDFYCVNYANPDMVGHSGNFKAGEKAVKTVDRCVKKVVDIVLKKDGQVLIIADHGNAEEMFNLKTGEIMTEHTTNPVPCILIRENTKGITLKPGKLADVAPTILNMMHIQKPKEMTGKSLL